MEVAGRLRLGFGAAGWEDEGAGVLRGPIKGRAGILGRRAVEGAGERHGEISGGLLRERVAGKTELTSGPGWSVGEIAARVTGLSAVRACGVGLLGWVRVLGRAQRGEGKLGFARVEAGPRERREWAVGRR